MPKKKKGDNNLLYAGGVALVAWLLWPKKVSAADADADADADDDVSKRWGVRWGRGKGKGKGSWPRKRGKWKKPPTTTPPIDAPDPFDPDAPPRAGPDTPPRAGPTDIGDVFDDYIKRAPGPDSLLQIVKDDNPANVAKMILAEVGAPNTGSNRIRLQKMISLSRWNFPYRLPQDSGKYWAVDIDGVYFDVRGAYFPANVNAETAILGGELPRRNLAWSKVVSKTGPGSSYGLIYIPDFDVVNGEVIAPSNKEYGPGMLPLPLLGVLGLTAEDIVA